jgi:hypothetical protein
MQLKLRLIFYVGVSLHNSIILKFPSLVHNVLLSNPKAIFQLDYQIDINPMNGENQQLVTTKFIKFEK